VFEWSQCNHFEARESVLYFLQLQFKAIFQVLRGQSHLGIVAVGFYSHMPFWSPSQQRQIAIGNTVVIAVVSDIKQAVNEKSMCLLAVALNYQTCGLMMDLSDGRFMQNGGCGYVLKPAVMRDEIAYFKAGTRETIPGISPQILHIKVCTTMIHYEMICYIYSLALLYFGCTMLFVGGTMFSGCSVCL